MKSTAEIRRDFLQFFADKGHEVVRSSSLVPAEDPTLLFTNAGMNQFKDVFLGAEKRSYTRAASSQKCVRAGGKHNDLDQVGYTARHHTFFEMLGNFSFGDYFKEGAILYAWELMTNVYGLDGDKLWVTVYETDDEAYGIWRDQVGVPQDRIVRIGDKPGKPKYESDNFWAMGDTGPCGPCSEIFYDHGPDYQGGPPGSHDEDGDRYIEIWNLVFMQFDRAADGTMAPLPAPCVDTGMGLERLAAVLQHENSNYRIDLMQALVRAAAEVTGSENNGNASLNVIADHIRACAFLIADGIVPSRDGRGYVLRRIIRRAIRHGYKLGMKKPFFHKMVAPLAGEMGDAYPELIRKGEQIENTLLEEEQRFSRTLDMGMGILKGVMEKAGEAKSGVIDGASAFLLYDTYGFPLDLTQDIARENDMTVDEEGFKSEMTRQQERARSAGKFSQQAQISADVVRDIVPTQFLGYEKVEAENCKVVAILVDGQVVNTLDPGAEGIVLLDNTPFYAESGGQVGDKGALRDGTTEFNVEDTIKLAGVFHAHVGQMLRGSLQTGNTIDAIIDDERRQSIVLHHSATHLMHAALKQVLGDHVEQRGSLVAPDHLRFDFTHPRAVSEGELIEIERLVNQQIRVNPDSAVDVMNFDDALKTGATALFGEKYGDRVRVVKFGDFSTELCGGTHVRRVGDIGQFKIVEESAIAAGIRRIVAVAGDAAVDQIQTVDRQLKDLARVLKVGTDAVEDRLRQMLERGKAMEKEIAELKSKMASASGDELVDSAEEVNGFKVLSARLDDVDPKALRDTVDRLKDRLGSAVVVIGGAGDGKVRLAAGVSKDLTSRIQAGNLVNFVAEQVGGRGGGRPDFAQAGGSQPENLDGALESVRDWVSDNS
ncbi:MAG: alanine--tRNA ligase [Gammaproteobacteria bacterium]|nr:alanine--tRNA ligase [Gammaproteobacteria bacterium]NNJ79579.1 alanine--tRNA ligase [Xanthomonadales bacterium]